MLNSGAGRASGRICSGLPFILVFFLLLLLVPATAEAVPFFARRIGRDCTYCHTLVPKLNETGRIFRANGYRFAGEAGWQDVRDWKTYPISVEAEFEGAFSRLKASGAKSESSDLKIEEAEIAAGGPMGRSGKVTSLVMLSFEDTGSGAEANFHKAFVQINDLAGGQGEGLLNFRAGRTDVGLPFLNVAGSVFGNQYLSDRTLNALTNSQSAVELNGTVVKEGSDSSFSQRYSAGLSREDIYGDNKAAGFYATYSFTVNEAYSLGVLFRTGKEKYGAVDTSYNKYGLGGEAEVGPVVLTAGVFKSDRNGAPERDDYMAEALYLPFSKLGFGARYELLKEHGKSGARSRTLMARYTILSNVYAQIEYRGLKDVDHVTGVNEDEQKLRATLQAIF